MKTFPVSLLSVAAAFLCTLPLVSPLLAQDSTLVTPAPTVSDVPTQTTTTTTTTTPDETKTTKTTVTTIPATPAPVVTTVITAPVQTATTTTTAVVPGQHVAEIEIVLTHGTVEAYFGRAPRGEKFSIGDASLHIKLPSTATVTKLASRDKSSDGANEVTVDNPWHVTVPFSEPGRYVFNIVEWDDDPAVAVALVKVDGVLKFEGHGRDDDLRNWPEKVYGEGVHRTGSREIAFDVE